MNSAAHNLAINLKSFRDSLGITQVQLALRCKIPRTTLSSIEAGAANPTLTVLCALANGLSIRLDELLEPKIQEIIHYRSKSLKTVSKSKGCVEIRKLLPESLPGTELDRFALKPGALLTGVPHKTGTREYLACESGQLTLTVAGERIDLKQGDVAIFPGNRHHSYHNSGKKITVAYSVVLFAGLAPIVL